MPPQGRRANPNSILDSLHPTASVAIGMVGIVVWVYTTFVTVSALNQQVAELNARINDKYQQAIDHSDANYAKMTAQISALQSMMIELRDSMRTVHARMLDRSEGK
jgi:N-acetylglucosamine-6-phosphate deacetylase